MSTVSNEATFSGLKDSLAALRTGSDDFARLVSELLAEIEDLSRQLADARKQLESQRREADELRRQLAEKPISPPETQTDHQLQARLVEADQDRLALEQELEQVRARAVEMSQTIVDQKRQLSEAHSQWANELRQLRRTLDKQATWITQHAGAGTASPRVRGSRGPAPHRSGAPPAGDPSDSREARELEREKSVLERDQTAPTPPAESASSDVVLGSVLSQFEMLQKDVARRRNRGAEEPPRAEKSGSANS